MKSVFAAVIEADSPARANASRLLSVAGHRVVEFPSPGRFLDSLSGDKPRLVLVNLELPGVSGWEIIRLLRGMDSTRAAFIIAVSHHPFDSKEAVHAFQLGADDFFQLPLDPELFTARLEALLRRTVGEQPTSAALLELSGLVLDPDGRTVSLNGSSLHLTPLEFDLLAYLLRGRDRVMTRSLILQEVWKTEPDLNTRTVDKCVERLRKNLAGWQARIETVSGVGYCLRA